MVARPLTTPPPTPSELRAFGLLMAAMVGLVFGLLIPWLWGLAWPLWPWPVAAVFALGALLAPRRLAPVQRLWLRIAHALGWVNTRLVLGLAFSLILVPVGVAMRLFRDPMARRLEPGRTSYRQPGRQPVKQNLERPF
ncbi:MAG: SxtJ family membrane protein [Gammaproteobacteria bacterium]|nr:SxtJ family membrane protein [Gammaproteobacteria bacterium]